MHIQSAKCKFALTNALTFWPCSEFIYGFVYFIYGFVYFIYGFVYFIYGFVYFIYGFGYFIYGFVYFIYGFGYFIYGFVYFIYGFVYFSWPTVVTSVHFINQLFVTKQTTNQGPSRVTCCNWLHLTVGACR